jgi:hypothetical protein
VGQSAKTTKTQETTKAPTKAKPVMKAAGSWQSITVDGKTIQVLRLFKKGKKCSSNENERKREMAILDMDEAIRQSFESAPEDFVNKYKIFTCDVSGKLDKAARPSNKSTATVASAYTWVDHDPDCGGVYY